MVEAVASSYPVRRCSTTLPAGMAVEQSVMSMREERGEPMLCMDFVEPSTNRQRNTQQKNVKTEKSVLPRYIPVPRR